MNTRKNILLTVLFAFVLSALALFRSNPALAVRVDDKSSKSSMKKQNITTLDELYFDGRNLDVTYLVRSRCDAMDHETAATLNAKRVKNVISFTITLQDLAPESGCGGSLRDIIVMSKIDLADLLDAQRAYFSSKGYKLADNVALTFPPVYSNMDVIGSAPEPEVSSPVSTLPARVSVTIVDFTTEYHCQLWKRDGSRKDGFDGYGSTLDQARQAAANECSRTNHPQCLSFSTNPANTTCDIQFEETERVVEYDASALPEGAAISSWACTLYKQDGSRDDGFEGSGRSESEARAAAAAKCKITNSTKCDIYSRDASRTTCAPAMRLEKPKPVAVWSCALWKKDGSRKDGFQGVGNTEMDARRDAIPRCQVTNNPRCEEYAMDPNHTQCTMEIMQSGAGN